MLLVTSLDMATIAMIDQYFYSHDLLLTSRLQKIGNHVELISGQVVRKRLIAGLVIESYK